MQVWLYVWGGGSIPCEYDLKHSFAQINMATSPLDRSRPSGPGVLFFDEITDQLCEFLKDTSRNSRERVLAIALASSALAEKGAWRLLKAGACDVFAIDQVANLPREVTVRFERWNDIDQQVQSPLVRNNLIGHGSAWTSIIRQVVEVASFTNAPVLIMGESGTGKELVARLIHSLDRRNSKGDLITLDCTTIVPELSGSEFFGHERGAFTGAISSRDGAFALANGGTLFLDEVGELPLPLQAQLLRVVQELTYKRIGGNAWQKTDFRLVCATNKDLLHQVAQGQFRHDLYYRIASVVCHLPSLRERPEDIMSLASHFMKELRPDLESLSFDKAVQEFLVKRSYPGNIRDLRQMVTRIAYRHVGSGPITLGHIPKEEWAFAENDPVHWHDESFESAIRQALMQGARLKEIGRIAEETAIRIAVGDENGNLQRAAGKLGVTDRALQMRRAVTRLQDGGSEVRETG
jgi:transcriptional regulator with GAF, ATPase, and Fis domain